MMKDDNSTFSDGQDPAMYGALPADSQRYIDMMYCDGFSAFAELQLAGFISDAEFNEALDMIAGTLSSHRKHEQLCEFRHMLAALYLAVSGEL